ncbi:5897_t:CDS:2 [Rhizophagus irregularis]|nr:5897_t:CDS:2 [Rhizophagus irregularis]
MSYDKYTLSIASRNKIQELKKHLEDGNINTFTDLFKSKSNFNSKDHESIIGNWILFYGSNEQTRKQIAGLKSQIHWEE